MKTIANPCVGAMRDKALLGIPGLDDILGGGIESGSSTLILGPAGTVKSLLAIIFALSLNGYQAAMPDENALLLHVHELLQYLNRHNATSFLTVAQLGLLAEMRAPIDVTYLADTVVMLRYFEAIGRMRRAISVVKKRAGRRETTIREYQIGPEGLVVEEPLTNFHGVLHGLPLFMGERAGALAERPA